MRRECLRCKVNMIQGRIFDSPSSGTLMSTDGKPASFRWMAENENIGYFKNFGTKIRAFKCPKCGMVEMVGEDFIK